MHRIKYRLRQKAALKRLQEQLSQGEKLDKKREHTVPLTITDINRIENEIATLKLKLK